MFRFGFSQDLVLVSVFVVPTFESICDSLMQFTGFIEHVRNIVITLSHELE